MSLLMMFTTFKNTYPDLGKKKHTSTADTWERKISDNNSKNAGSAVLHCSENTWSTQTVPRGIVSF